MAASRGKHGDSTAKETQDIGKDEGVLTGTAVVDGTAPLPTPSVPDGSTDKAM